MPTTNKRPDFDIPVHDERQLSWGGLTATVDASTLDKGGRQPITGRVWNDAVDVGFMVHSQKIGRDVLFVEERVDRNPDGEVTGTWYVSYGYRVEYRILVVNT